MFLDREKRMADCSTKVCGADLGDSEIADLQLAVAHQEEILALEIAMQDVLVVNELQS